MGDHAGAADRVDRRPPVVIRLPAGPQQHHPDDPIAAQRLRHHLPVARLEDVQRQEDVGKEHHVRQRENRDGGRQHDDCDCRLQIETSGLVSVDWRLRD